MLANDTYSDITLLTFCLENKMVVETGPSSVEQKTTLVMQNRGMHDRYMSFVQDKGMPVLQNRGLPTVQDTVVPTVRDTVRPTTKHRQTVSPTVESKADMPTVEEESSEEMKQFLSHQTFYSQGFVRCEGFLMPRCFLKVSF
jgi:hypothetical protein